ncbi:MAG: ankyrin repeat domain-containing protein [Planctomycetota bacterium]|jgi:hypothetical protein|nr:ankyrin repeat domain-containing protein [Planctomycetota bacterium]
MGQRTLWVLVFGQFVLLAFLLMREPPAAAELAGPLGVESSPEDLEQLRKTMAALAGRVRGLETSPRVQGRATGREVVPGAELVDLQRRIARLEERWTTLAQGQQPLPTPFTVPRIDSEGLTGAAAGGDLDKVQELLAGGMDIEAKGARGFTALTAAIHQDKNGVAKELIRRGADVNARDANEETPLFWATFRGNLGMTKRLLDAGAKINARSRTGNTPLFDAIRAGKKKVVELLLRRGADPNQADSSGRTPLSLAGDALQAEMVKILKRYGAR